MWGEHTLSRHIDSEGFVPKIGAHSDWRQSLASDKFQENGLMAFRIALNRRHRRPASPPIYAGFERPRKKFNRQSSIPICW